MSKVAWITGAGTGIGRATAMEFARQGVDCFLVGRTEKTLRETQSLVQTLKVRCEYSLCDVSKEAQVQKAHQALIEKFGQYHYLINNAAIFRSAMLTEQTVTTWDEVMNINVRGVFLCTREALVFWQKHKVSGSIVNVSSIAGISMIEKFPGASSYIASKFAVIGLTESSALEARPFGIRVNGIAPGAVDTEMLHKAAPQLKTDAKPEHIAKSIWYLCDETKSGHITGTTLVMNTNAD